jgi:hypothetical protein
MDRCEEKFWVCRSTIKLVFAIFLASTSALGETWDDTSNTLESEFIPPQTATRASTISDTFLWTAPSEATSTGSLVILILLTVVFVCIVTTMGVCLFRKLRGARRHSGGGGEEPLLLSGSGY